MAANKVTAVHGQRWEQIPKLRLRSRPAGAWRLFFVGAGEGNFPMRSPQVSDCALATAVVKSPSAQGASYSIPAITARSFAACGGYIGRRTVVRDGFRTEPFLQHFRENDFPFACWEVKGLRRGRRLSARRSQGRGCCNTLPY